MAEDETKFLEWHGVPRKKIKWNPEVDYEKCVGCGMCAAGCGRNVYEWDFDLDKPVVARPENCLAGCVTCANTCLKDAISFPPKDAIRKAIVENHVLTNVRKELEKKFGKKENNGDCGCVR